MTPKVLDAFEIASEIKSLMLELIEACESISKDEELNVQARHLVLEQLTGSFDSECKVLGKMADEFIENEFPEVKPGTTVVVQGFEAGDRFVAGKNYKYSGRDTVEILNSDPRNWEHVVKLLVDNGYSRVIQKRLNASEFTSSNGAKLLELMQGLVNVKTTCKWSSTKAKAPK